MSTNLYQAYAYSPYGHAAAGKSQLGFNGEFREPLCDLYPLGNGHRMYNPRLSRFHSPDNLSPFGKGGINSYCYCAGDPINYLDPFGRNRFLAMMLRPAGRNVVKTVATGTLTAFAYDKRELLTEFGQTIKHTIIPGELTMKDASPARQLIDQHTAASTRVFNRGLKVSNQTLASNGNGSVGYRQAETYVSDSKQDWSDTFKFARSTGRWMEKAIVLRRPDAAAGALLNGSSAVLASAHDHTMYKTGKVFTEAYAIQE